MPPRKSSSFDKIEKCEKALQNMQGKVQKYKKQAAAVKKRTPSTTKTRTKQSKASSRLMESKAAELDVMFTDIIDTTDAGLTEMEQHFQAYKEEQIRRKSSTPESMEVEDPYREYDPGSSSESESD
ncbi:hypothetical protein EW146_g5301 [Bondarzewia mesenterica]|uniref:Uncharacterized protein n=1 Tax=Bondarzewia mesenterica TaxID=1095465 RepID=A0A4S4LXQ7_9AGAM|nr:hypothetical protein EW146_g5301 [Bondarzewia mesenterica]